MQDVCNLVTLSWYTVARILTDYNYIYKHFSYVSGISCIVAGIRTSVRTWLRTVSLVCWSSDHNIVCPEMYRKQIRRCLNGSWWCVTFALPCTECCHTHRWCPRWPHFLLEEAGVQAIPARNVARSSESEILKCNRNSKKECNFVYKHRKLYLIAFSLK